MHTGFPAGNSDEDESEFTSMACSELREELGIEVDPKELVPLIDTGISINPSLTDDLVYLYYFSREVSLEWLKAMDGRSTGCHDEGEFLTIRVHKISELAIMPTTSTLIALPLLEKALSNDSSNSGQCVISPDAVLVKDPNRPLVSILCVVKNGAKTIRRCIESVLAQDYPNLEFIVQDGASTDGTQKIFRDYQDQRIRLVSEPDSCGEEGFFRALRRATGDIIGFCLADEELLHHAAQWAVDNMLRYTEAGAIYGDLYMTDAEGNITCSVSQLDFDLTQFICRRLYPHMCATFIRRSALLTIGLNDRDWPLDVGDTELFLRLGLKFPIIHAPGIISKYSYHPQEMSMNPDFINNLMLGTIRLMEDFFTDPLLPDNLKAIKNRAFGNLYLNFAGQYIISDTLRKTSVSFSNIADLFAKAFQYQPDADYAETVGRTLFDYAVNLFKEKQFSESVICMDLLESKNLTTTNLYYLQALALMHCGRMPEAEAYAKKELRQTPEHNGANMIVKIYQLLQFLHQKVS